MVATTCSQTPQMDHKQRLLQVGSLNRQITFYILFLIELNKILLIGLQNKPSPSTQTVNGQLSPAKQSSSSSSSTMSTNLQVSSPASSSLIDFFSSNKQSLLLSQRSSMIQQQMQATKPSESQTPMSPMVPPSPKPVSSIQSQSQSSQPSIVASPSVLFDSPKSSEPTTTLSPGNANAPGFPRLSHSKVPIDILFDQIDTSLYLNKIGTYKYFRFKNVLTLGDLCSLSCNAINSFPFRAPKLENYQCMIRCFEEKCADRIKRFDNGPMAASWSGMNSPLLPPLPPPTNSVAQEKQNLVSMGSVEEEMEKLETSSNCNLDTSIECEAVMVDMCNQDERKNKGIFL